MPAPLDYATPRPERPPKDYGGCLFPLAFGVLLIACLIYLMDDPLGPSETDAAVRKFITLAMVLALLVIGGVISWYRKR